jgi:hypothetical protein
MWRLVAVFGAVLTLNAGGAQGPELSAVMREKLVHSQKILETVVTSNWATLESETRQLQMLTRDRRWTVLRYPEYATHSAAFVRALDALRVAAAQRDLEATPKAYVGVVQECVACHRYVARMRIAQ